MRLTRLGPWVRYSELQDYLRFLHTELIEHRDHLLETIGEDYARAVQAIIEDIEQEFPNKEGSTHHESREGRP